MLVITRSLLIIVFVIQCDSVTNIVNLTVYIVAILAVVDAVAVADSETALGAVPPDRVLDEPGKHGGEPGIEGARVDPIGRGLNNVSTAAAPVAGRPVGMGRAEPMQDAGAVQKVVNERVDGDHAGPDFMPEPQLVRRSEQEGRQGHGEDLVGDAVDFAQRCNDGVSHARQPVGPKWVICRLQPLIDPADEIAIGGPRGSLMPPPMRMKR